MSRKIQTVKQSSVKPITVKSPVTVAFEKGFHFYTSVGNYTGITATSLSEFAMKLQTIPAESVAFHFQRNDFQNWIKYTLKDNALAARISNAKRGQTAEDVRKEILKVIEARKVRSF
jgi:hypothetical protein